MALNSLLFFCFTFSMLIIRDNGAVYSLNVTGAYYVHAPEIGSKIPVKHQGFFANSQQFKYPVLIQPKSLKPKTNNNNNE